MIDVFAAQEIPQNSGSYQRAVFLFAVFAYRMIMPIGTAYLSYN